jgi:CrcB protein
MTVIIVGLGGFVGTVFRYGITKFLTAVLPDFPLGTLLSNVLAGLAIGFIIGLERQDVSLSGRTRLFLTTGLLGGLSTFSTFSIETITMLEAGRYMAAGANVLLNLGLSLLCVVAGLFLARLVKA